MANKVQKCNNCKKILAFDSVFSDNTIIETKHIKGTHYGKQHHEHRKQYQHFDTA